MQFVLELARIETVGVPVDKELLTKVRAKNMAEMEDIEKPISVSPGMVNGKKRLCNAS